MRRVPVVVGRAVGLPATEAAWREARWRFLRAAAAELGATRIATGHTRDDQVETVAIRVLRGAGARGLAGLAAPSDEIVRPLLGVGRGTIAAYVAARGLPAVEDPSNRSPRWLRNRLRHELLPALERASPPPGLAEALLEVGEAAAAWRADVDAFVARHLPVEAAEGGGVRVALASLRGYDAESLAVLWPAIAARGGVRLDRRGTRRVVQFTIRRAAEAAAGASIQLAGGAEVVARRGELVLRPAIGVGLPGAGDFAWAASELALDGVEVRLGHWIFRPTAGVGDGERDWTTALPAGAAATVRAWRPGDRMQGLGWARRVKRFLADARIPGPDRTGWPVVLVDGEIVWIPGVRRSDAATVRPGEPGICYICERIHT
jgi:tRNA(Ile)-lysidine synthase